MARYILLGNVTCDYVNSPLKSPDQDRTIVVKAPTESLGHSLRQTKPVGIRYSKGVLEAEAGIEPAYTALQAAA